MKKDEILADVEAKRGYLLPYHRMLANDDPELLEAYDRLYERLTLLPRVLTAKERETVWLGLLAAIEEKHGHIHAKRAVSAGLTQDDIADAVALAGVAEAHRTGTFAADNWPQWLSQDAATQRYLKMAEAARGSIPVTIAEITLSVCHAAHGRSAAQKLHLLRAFEAGASVGQVSEATSYLLLPCGGPTLIEAVSTWEDAAKSGLCPSPYGE